MDFKNLSIQSLHRRQGIKWKNYDEAIIPAWVADMDFPVAESIRRALTDCIKRSDLGYPVSAEDSGLPKIFVRRARERFNWRIDSKDVFLINDVVQGLYQGVYTLSEENQGVIVQTPIYPPFLQAVRDLNRKLLANPLCLGDAQYEIDFDHLSYCVKQKAGILMFCNPHNPSGRAFSRVELEKLAKFACEHGLILLSDEIHADLILDDITHIPIASIDKDVAKRTVTFMSASKAFNIAGLCLAFAHFGHDDLIKSFKSLPGHLTGGVNALSIAAVKAAWESGDEWLQHVLCQLKVNREFVREHVASRWPNVNYYPAEATYLAWLDMHKVGPGEKMAQYFLEKSKVALSEGETFGIEGKGFVRLNFATSTEVLSELLRRMDHAVVE